MIHVESASMLFSIHLKIQREVGGWRGGSSLARPAPHTLRGKRVWSNSHVAFVFNTPQFWWRVNHRLSV